LKKIIVIIGGSSFIGKKLINKINKKNLLIYSTYFKNIPKISNVKHVYLNLNNLRNEDLNKFPKMIDNLIILSWGDLNNYQSPKHEFFYKDLNKFTKKILIHAKVHEINIVGSCQEYGLANGELSENAKCFPTTNYAKYKLKYLNQVKKLKFKHNFRFNWLRLFYIYGDNRDRGIWSNFMKAKKANKVFKMSKGEQKFDFLHINTIMKYMQIVTMSKNDLGIINICSGKPTKLIDLIRKWASRYGVKIKVGFYPYTNYESMAYWGSNKKLKRVLLDNA